MSVRQPSLFLAHSGEISLESYDEIYVQFYIGWRNLHMHGHRLLREQSLEAYAVAFLKKTLRICENKPSRACEQYFHE